MADDLSFPPTLAAALERLAVLDLDQYSRTRNSLTGAVSHLSPYITHGFLTLPDISHALTERSPLDQQHKIDLQHKFVNELGWREYSRHLWRRHGDGIFRSLHPGVLPDAAYAPELPDDLRDARTGIPAVDLAVRTLNEGGYLHNHARMWLASYIVHIRKVSWRAGADWMVALLLDGDLASNHLGWQWIAGTASTKPYLFNADNVARFAPADWHSPGTVIDTSYEALDSMARTPPTPAAMPTPAPAYRAAAIAADAAGAPLATPPAPAAPPAWPAPLAAPPPRIRLSRPDASTIAGRDVWLIHPWALRSPPPDLAADLLLVGVFITEFHRQWPWSSARWTFVCSRMQALTPHCWYGNAILLADTLRSARTVSTVADPHFSLRELETLTTRAAPQLFAAVAHLCTSFSQWWSRVTAASMH